MRLMITTLREGKAKLSALVESAARGEEVVIMVRGKPRARLCAMFEAPPQIAISACVCAGVLIYMRKCVEALQDL